MTDLTKQLRHIALRKRDEIHEEEGKTVSHRGFIEWRAAKEIESLRAENKRLRSLLRTESEQRDLLSKQHYRERIEELEVEKAAIVNAYHEREMKLIAENERLKKAIKKWKKDNEWLMHYDLELIAALEDDDGN